MKLTSILFVGLAAAAAASELKVDVYEGPTECGQADKVEMAALLGIHYTGTIDESSKTGKPGSQFDSSRGRGVMELTIGVGQVIEGWDKGFIGLCKGAKAILVIPPEMGYGTDGVGDNIIPGDATLKFDVEVVSVQVSPPQPNLFLELDVNQDKVLTPEEILAHFQREDPNAELPPGLMDRDDTNKDGVVSWEEFGGPKMPKNVCLEMLFQNYDNAELKHAVRWLCQRRDLKAESKMDEGEL